MHNQLDRVSDYDSQQKNCQQLERDYSQLEEKLKRQRDELNDTREQLRSKQALEKQLDELRKLHEQSTAKSANLAAEVKKLREFETLARQLESRCAEKESYILKLVDRNSFLEAQDQTNKNKFNAYRSNCDERFDELEGQNAALNCQLNALRAELSNKTDESKQQIDHLTREVCLKFCFYFN